MDKKEELGGASVVVSEPRADASEQPQQVPEKGLYTPPPLFVNKTYCPYTYNLCEDSDVCHKIGSCGTQKLPFGLERHTLMYIALFFSCIGQIFMIVGVAALSTNNQTVMNTGWATAYYTGPLNIDRTVYIGLKELVVVQGHVEVGAVGPPSLP